MSGSKDLARADSLTRSGTGCGTAGTNSSRMITIDSSDTRTVSNVDDFVFVIESSLYRMKLENATKGSRCWTSARTAKRMSGLQLVNANHSERAGYSTIVCALICRWSSVLKVTDHVVGDKFGFWRSFWRVCSLR